MNQFLILLYFLLSFAGAVLTASDVAANTCLQERVTNQHRGRIASLFQLTIHGKLSVVDLLTGMTVAHLGVSKPRNEINFNPIVKLNVRTMANKQESLSIQISILDFISDLLHEFLRLTCLLTIDNSLVNYCAIFKLF